MAAAFRDSHYEIRPMLKVLLTSPEFYDPAIRGAKIKGPVRLLLGACRDLRLIGIATPSLVELAAASGQELFNSPTVKGWSAGTSWISPARCRYDTAWAKRRGRPDAGGATAAGPAAFDGRFARPLKRPPR